MLTTHVLGYPRIGGNRQLKRSVEAYWSDKLPGADLLDKAAQLRLNNWTFQQKAGIDWIPSNDFSFYDQMLDTACLVGAIPSRYAEDPLDVSLETYFAMARGRRGDEETSCDCKGPHHRSSKPLEMTKWFDTNYHYIKPEFTTDQKFHMVSTKPFADFQEAVHAGIKTKPVLIGPATLLFLGKFAESDKNPLVLLNNLIPVYGEILKRFAQLGAEWVQIDEPIFSLDLTPQQKEIIQRGYQKLEIPEKIKVLFTNYFGELRDNDDLFFSLPGAGFHVDAVRGLVEFDQVLKKLPEKAVLSLGIVDGRNIWKNDFTASLQIINKAVQALGADRVWIGTSCSLMHSPVALRYEEKMDAELKSWLSFAEEKVEEVVALSKLASDPEKYKTLLDQNQKAIKTRHESSRIHKSHVQKRFSQVKMSDAQRHSAYSERRLVQEKALKLPLLPTTTIGSFPQTKEIRNARKAFKEGSSSESQYNDFIKKEIKRVVELQEKLDIDVLVHGEAERNDMVEYFGENFAGFAFSENGWVQSYGSRCVKPPIIFGDVERAKPITVEWSKYAQSLTKKLMKGMLTGPVTILQWSFVREDQPRKNTAYQIALALRDEVVDLEKAGIKVIQIDEPAYREGLPLRNSDQASYLNWASEAFRLSASGVKDETQIHTHMCYCEFNDIMPSIASLDADVISIEASRSEMELLNAFEAFHYPNEIGPGVWDIHSPRVPSKDEIIHLLEKAIQVLPAQRVWVNPDCGLKTRAYPETTTSLQNLMAATKEMRNKLNVPTQ